MSRSYYNRGRRVYVYSIIAHPLWRFIKDFLVRRGFLDGYYGFIVSINSAHEVFLKYVKLRNIYKDEKRNRRQTTCFFNSMESWGGGEKWHRDVADWFIKQESRAIYISSAGSPLSKKLGGSGVTGYEMKVSNLSFLNPFKLIKIARIYRKEQVGAVITNLSGDMKLASLAARLAGVRKIIYRRGSAIPIRNTILNRYLLRNVITKIIANSEETKRTILANNASLVPEGKIKVIYNGVDLPRYHPGVKPFYQAKEGEIVLGCAGRLSEEKGHVYLLEMMKDLKKETREYRLLIAGEGRLLHILQRKARKLGVADRVDFLGFVEDMPSFYVSLDIFLLSSDYEGFGYVIAEAMASRKPVLAFDIKSSAEIVDHKKTGYLTRPGNVKEMTSRVIELEGNEALREEMGIEGRKRVEELFAFEKKQEEIKELITCSEGY